MPAPPMGPPRRAPRLRVSEMFLSLQGEGLSAGTPAAFLRLQGCDVGCHWCDSRYTWDPARGRELSVEEALGELEQLGFAPMLVVTGGEPLQHDGIAELLDAAVPRWGRVEVETSGVLPPPLRGGGLFWNVSPKLPSATPRWRETWAHAAAWVDESRATFKIVVGGEQDLDEVRRLLVVHDLPRDRVLLMPEGVTDAALRERAAWLAEACKREGLRMSPRLHVWLWGARRGV